MFATNSIQNTDLRTVAVRRYENLRVRAEIGRLWAALTRRARSLLALPARQPAEQHFAGQQPVALEAIQGSEGRSADFDRDFNPLTTTTLERWVNIFKARAQGQELPPVDLVQYDGAYYVRDGHHRISVARARGEAFIDARVTLWR
jgi:hypothetical protein